MNADTDHGYGYGDGSGSGDGYGYGSGSGDGYGYGSGSGSGYGYGSGSGYGYGSGSGDGYGYGSGDGYGYGYGYGSGGSKGPPSFGAFAAWKKASCGIVVRLEIPSDARRLIGSDEITSGKCRASKARVMEIISSDGPLSEARSIYDKAFVYRVGETVEPSAPFDEADVTCSTGIHFFMSREEAEKYG